MPFGCECINRRSGADCSRDASSAGWGWAWREEGEGLPPRPARSPPPTAAHTLLNYGEDLLRVGGETFSESALLYRYKTAQHEWVAMEARGESPLPRFAHAAVLYGNELIVYGGVVASDEPDRGGGLAGLEGRAGEVTNEVWRARVDGSVAEWRNATPTTCSPHRPAPLKHCGVSARAAHAAALLPLRSRPTAIVHGGFDGRLRSDALIFTAGDECSSRNDETSCLNSAAVAAIACVWTRSEGCVSMAVSVEECSAATAGTEACGRYHSCAACHAHLHRHPHGSEELSQRACYWDYDSVKCRPANASTDISWVLKPYPLNRRIYLMECVPIVLGNISSNLPKNLIDIFNVAGSEELSQRACYWDYDSVKCRPANASTDIRSVAATASGVCSAACATFRTCANCTAEECIWCASAGRCVDKNAYGASFPLGGCRAWSTNGCAGGGIAANVPGAGCAAHLSCSACLAEPACGWCDDGAGGGRGACLPGGERHPHHPHVCPHRRWHFTSCPACQCNGHAVCDSMSRCIQPCGARAIGTHCETCAPAHWGSPLNGGVCQPCECNAQAVSCATDTGRCYCSTKGLAGDRCDKCDNTNHYHADSFNKGCYYDLAVDYQFTFNLSKKEDRHLSAINFRNAPVKPDVDADFSITCSAHARMNLTVRTRTDPAEKTLFSDVNCSNFRYKFAKSEHAFGVEDNVTLTTFFVYVYDFRPPLWIQISFSQYPKLNLQQFFITFSSCFLLLLLVAAALWKIKQKYDLYRRRQRLFVEMEQMASRPFSQVSIELEKCGGANGVPAPVALEPCRSGRAAVLSLLVRLPTGGTGRAPPLGGLALASALVTLGHQHHQTQHQATDRWRHQCK
ncbi:jg14380 [Pararge aegeria aegeria]|uniref:Jg14380 protein n=1 Tax=Pararge aegeria aegeria TaxID=348720 RepID=A0A8S4SBV4_9NEOP|nr:jg14380 [Pararge aegeria aegeria]